MRSNPPGRELKSQKLRARYLIVVKGYNQKEAAQLVGVSERTICVWANKYKWKDVQDNKELLEMGGLASIMDGYIEFVKKHAPDIVGDVKNLWLLYLEKVRGTSSM